jgi:mevalonate pyrophosphate decarboxylase
LPQRWPCYNIAHIRRISEPKEITCGGVAKAKSHHHHHYQPYIAKQQCWRELDYLVAVVRTKQQDTMSMASHKTKVSVGRTIVHSHGYLERVSKHLAYDFGVDAEPETQGFGRQH